MPMPGVTQAESRHPAAAASAAAASLVTAVAGLALLVLLVAWRGHQVRDVPGFGLLVVAALLCGSRTIRISQVATISVGLVVVFGTLVHLGLPEACVVGAVSGLAASFLSPERYARSPLVLIYASASIVVTAWVAGEVFEWAGGRPGAIDPYALALPATLAAITYHTINCVLVAGVAGLASGGRAWGVFREHINRSAPAYYGGAGWAVLVHLAWQLSGPWALIAAAPPLYSLHSALLRWARAANGK